MKEITSALIGAGGACCVFVAYLVLSGQAEVKQETRVESAKHEIESATFDKEFSEQLGSIDGRKIDVSKSTSRIKKAENALGDAEAELEKLRRESDADRDEIRKSLREIDNDKK